MWTRARYFSKCADVVVGPTVMAIVVVQPVVHGHDGTTVDHLIMVDCGGTVASTSIF